MELRVKDISIDRVEGLSELNRQLLEQRGSVSRVREAGRKIRMLGSKKWGGAFATTRKVSDLT